MAASSAWSARRRRLSGGAAGREVAAPTLTLTGRWPVALVAAVMAGYRGAHAARRSGRRGHIGGRQHGDELIAAVARDDDPSEEWYRDDGEARQQAQELAQAQGQTEASPLTAKSPGRAYLIHLQEGECDWLADWLRAERELATADESGARTGRRQSGRRREAAGEQDGPGRIGARSPIDSDSCAWRCCRR